MIKRTFGMAALVLACAGAMTVLPSGNAQRRRSQREMRPRLQLVRLVAHLQARRRQRHDHLRQRPERAT